MAQNLWFDISTEEWPFVIDKATSGINCGKFEVCENLHIIAAIVCNQRNQSAIELYRQNRESKALTANEWAHLVELCSEFGNAFEALKEQIKGNELSKENKLLYRAELFSAQTAIGDSHKEAEYMRNKARMLVIMYCRITGLSIPLAAQSRLEF